MTRRNPGVVASATIPIQATSGGRAICGVASGDSAVAAAGLEPQRIPAMERDLTALQAYLRGEEVRLGERTSRIEWADGFPLNPFRRKWLAAARRRLHSPHVL
jgi:alkanesulfonate monooxygenase SsuD/methylene tetrahydromethanopterin reductase-like flavin-dependent oxidoreductase (luciferase family)